MVITTDDFRGICEESAVTQGLASARIVSVEHPIGAIPEAGLRARAVNAADESLALLTGAVQR